MEYSILVHWLGMCHLDVQLFLNFTSQWHKLAHACIGYKFGF